MNKGIRKTVWVILGAGFALPFILQTTLYPFFRFGMFAEPVQYSIQEERFLLLQVLPDGTTRLFVPDKAGINKSKLDYLLRNYYYRNETSQMLEYLKAVLPDSTLTAPIRMIRIAGQDTIIVGEIANP